MTENITKCGECQQFKPNEKALPGDWNGKCKSFGIKRSDDTEACSNERKQNQ